MPNTHDPKAVKRNRLLALLSPDVLDRLLPLLTKVPYKTKDIMYEQDQPIMRTYFPTSGVISLVSIDKENAETVEVATVGNEGMLGLPLFLKADRLPLKAFAQVPGEGFEMSAEHFKEVLEEDNRELSTILNRYVLALFNQLAQHAACNGSHKIEERCARWLLMTHDRVDSDEFPLTQEFIAQMLGVRRSSVTLAAKTLQQAGLITYNRGIIQVLDRKGLEEASCNHYWQVRKEYDRLLGPKENFGER